MIAACTKLVISDLTKENTQLYNGLWQAFAEVLVLLNVEQVPNIFFFFFSFAPLFSSLALNLMSTWLAPWIAEGGHSHCTVLQQDMWIWMGRHATAQWLTQPLNTTDMHGLNMLGLTDVLFKPLVCNFCLPLLAIRITVSVLVMW